MKKRENEKVSISEFSRRVGISQARAYVLLREGKLSFLEKVKIGRQTWLFFDEKKIARGMVPFNDSIKVDLLKAKYFIDRVLNRLVSGDLAMAKRLISRNEKK